MSWPLPAQSDHVGSFLRPKYLLDAREKHAKGAIDAAALRDVEDRAIEDVIRMQEEVGLQAITDGEFRRTYFHGSEELAPSVMRVTGKVRHGREIQRADFEFLQTHTRRTPKVTIPSPTMLHFRGGRAGISEKHYPDLEQFYEDTARAYGDELKSLSVAGCNYVQMDDTNELPHCYARFINRVVALKPAGMTLAVHLCPGNFKSAHAAEGGYEPVAEALLSEMNVDAYFLEYDDERSAATSGRCDSCRRAKRWYSAWSLPSSARSRRATTSGAASGSREIRTARAAGPLPTMRFLEHLARQRHPGEPAGGEAATGRRRRKGSLERALIRRLAKNRAAYAKCALLIHMCGYSPCKNERASRRIEHGVHY